MENKITIVVPTFNKSQRLCFFLESLKHQVGDVGFETIIVDDGSIDETKNVIEQYANKIKFQYYYQNNSGRSHARNLGLAHVKSKYSLFVDDDMILPPDFVKNHYDSLINNTKKVTHGKIWNLPFLSFFKDPSKSDLIENYQENTKIKHLNKYLITLDSVRNQSNLDVQRRLSLQEKYLNEIYQEKIERLFFLMCTGNNFSCETEALIKVGGFDEKIDNQWGVEDIELGYRLQHSGYGFVYDHKSYNYHICHYRKTYREELINSFNLFYEKYHDDIILNIPKLLLREIKSLDEFKDLYIN